MKRSWSAWLDVKGDSVKLRVWDAKGSLALRAELVRHPDHPRALLTLLEGLALWSGAQLYAAISAPAPAGPSLDLAAVDDQGWPEESALVRFQLLERNRAHDLGSRRGAKADRRGTGDS